MYPEPFQTVCLGILPKSKPQCIAGIQQGYGEQLKHQLVLDGRLVGSEWLPSVHPSKSQNPTPLRKNTHLSRHPIQRAVLLIGCTALHFSHSPWSLKLYGCLCQRHSPIATNGSHGHCISVSAERLGVHRDPGVWFCLVWWSQGSSFPNNRTFPRWSWL
jgi:hypothetical protein